MQLIKQITGHNGPQLGSGRLLPLPPQQLADDTVPEGTGLGVSVSSKLMEKASPSNLPQGWLTTGAVREARGQVAGRPTERASRLASLSVLCQAAALAGYINTWVKRRERELIWKGKKVQDKTKLCIISYKKHRTREQKVVFFLTERQEQQQNENVDTQFKILFSYEVRQGPVTFMAHTENLPY